MATAESSNVSPRFEDDGFEQISEKPLDFVRHTFTAMRKERDRLQRKVSHLEDKLSEMNQERKRLAHTLVAVRRNSQNMILQPEASETLTAELSTILNEQQSTTSSFRENGVEELAYLLAQAKAARQEAVSFAKVGRSALVQEVIRLTGRLKETKTQNKQLQSRVQKLETELEQSQTEAKQVLEKAQRDRTIFAQLIADDREKHSKQLSDLQRHIHIAERDKSEAVRQFTNYQSRFTQELQSLQQKFYTESQNVAHESEVTDVEFSRILNRTTQQGNSAGESSPTNLMNIARMSLLGYEGYDSDSSVSSYHMMESHGSESSSRGEEGSIEDRSASAKSGSTSHRDRDGDDEESST